MSLNPMVYGSSKGVRENKTINLDSGQFLIRLLIESRFSQDTMCWDLKSLPLDEIAQWKYQKEKWKYQKEKWKDEKEKWKYEKDVL
ncbi:hypothetical protein BgiMline_004646 [Biomphalaria glabrata]|nr:hypothetical protein BgiMline_002745 [Biomphalaria glabrata]